MSGRGRGRGKYTPPTGGKAFLMRSAEECGLDSRNLRSLQDITKPALFPDMKLHSAGDNRMLRLLERQEEEERIKMEENGGGGTAQESKPKPLSGVKRSQQTVFLMTKGREIHQRIQSSVFYVRPTKDVPDVVRYSDVMKAPPQIDASAVLSNCLGGRKRTKMGLYVPEELVSGQRVNISGGHESSARNDVNLADLEANERQQNRYGQQVDEGDGDQDDVLGEVDEGEESDGEYGKDYYDSNDDDDGGDDGEPTF